MAERHDAGDDPRMGRSGYGGPPGRQSAPAPGDRFDGVHGAGYGGDAGHGRHGAHARRAEPGGGGAWDRFGDYSGERDPYRDPIDEWDPYRDPIEERAPHRDPAEERAPYPDPADGRDPYRDPVDGRDPYRDPVDEWDPAAPASGGWYAEPGTGEHLEPEPPSGAVVAQHLTAPRGEQRSDFGAHLETHYARIVAQLYAITLHPGDAHDAVQDAYSRAWLRWTELRAEDDAAGTADDAGADDAVVSWVRRVAIRTSMRGWRQGLTRVGLRKPTLPDAESVGPETAELLESLATLGPAVRRAVVLRHMAGLGTAEIAELERISQPTLRERLRRGRDAVQEGLDEMLGRVIDAVDAMDGRPAGHVGDDAPHAEQTRATGRGRHGRLGERS